MSDKGGFSWDKILGQGDGDDSPAKSGPGSSEADLHDILRQISDKKSDGDAAAAPEPVAPEVTAKQPEAEPPVTPPATFEMPPVVETVVTPPVTETPVSEAPVSAPPVFESPVTEPPIAQPPIAEPPKSSIPDVFLRAIPDADESTDESADEGGAGYGWARPKSELEAAYGDDFGKGMADLTADENGLVGHAANMPAPVPTQVSEPEKYRGKYFVDDEMQDTGIARVNEDVLPIGQAHMDDLLRMAVERKASDIHLTAGLPPMIRLDGEVVPLPYEVLSPQQTQRLIYEVLGDEQLEKFENTHELDFGYSVRGLARFRFNVYMQRTSVAGAMRMIPNRIPSFDELRLPPIIREIAKRSSGLVLVTGPTGSGKSTTIASMIDDINETRQGHIMTIEDPIEYLHRHKKCMVNQRELGSDTYSLHNALRAVLREDPDIILVGELRDLETIEAALTLAETGHLVFGTLHTRNAPATIDRVVDVFPSEQQDQIRVLMANTIEGVISQQLLPKLGGGRCAALEIMTGIPAIKNLIREGKTHQMYSVIETSRNLGMQTMDSSLAALFRTGQVSYEECLMRSVDKESFARLAKSAA